ncbi:hypothetical protein [Nocardioides mesophilus]|uniref:Uncharacterized protein n=1 Tax=Nocardioides mesophilus TaxID=433659 RepID=A0A7G9RCP3_9ACTN|nr:hypothetical protein [Nocardioides mesophilus]QNN53368.1 hypothetical protein H9L09_02565 [Nocardioides mesophilus]
MSEQQQRSHKAGAFDIRVFIGALIGVYGVVLVLVGLLGTTDADLEMAGGLNINLWAGIGMIVAAACFLLWARWRPTVIPDDDTEASSS